MIKKSVLWISVALVLILILIFLRSCYGHRQGHPTKNFYTIGRDATWYSLELLGRERSLLAFTNDLMALVSQESHMRFELLMANPDSLLSGLDFGAYDAVLSTLRPDTYNKEKYLFSDLIFETGPVLVVTEDSPVTSLVEMQGKTVAIRSGTTLAFNAVRQGGANVYDFLLLTYPNASKAMDDVANNIIDGAIIDALPAYTLTNGFYAGKLKVVTPPLNDAGLRIVALKKPASEPLIKGINEALHTLKENGSYDALIEKWGLIDAERLFLHPPEASSS